MKFVTRLAVVALPVLLVAGCQTPAADNSKVDSAVESSKMAVSAAERASAAAKSAAAAAPGAANAMTMRPIMRFAKTPKPILLPMPLPPSQPAMHPLRRPTPMPLAKMATSRHPGAGAAAGADAAGDADRAKRPINPRPALIRKPKPARPKLCPMRPKLPAKPQQKARMKSPNAAAGYAKNRLRQWCKPTPHPINNLPNR